MVLPPSPFGTRPSRYGRPIAWARQGVCSPRGQVIALCLAVTLPLALLIALTQTPAWPEILPAGDDALTELAVWHSLHDVQLTGICSHNCFRNPGPMYFYLLAPLYWLSGYSRASFPVSVGLINLVSLVGVLLVISRSAGRMALLGAAVLLTFYVRFLTLGSLVSSWPADVQTLPVLLAVVLFAAVAAGRRNCLPAAILAASLPLQTNVAYIPSLTVVAALALLLVFVPGLRRWAQIDGPISGSRRRVLVASLAALALLWALPVVRELTQTGSDMAQVVDFFTRNNANRTWSEALFVLAGQLAAFPRFCLTGHRNPALACGPAWVVVLAAVAQGILLAVAYGLARRMKRGFDAVLSLLCIALLTTFAVSIHRIVGPIVPHMVHWMTIASVLLLFVVVETCAAALATRLSPQTVARWRPVVAALLLALLAVGFSMNVRDATREPARRMAEEFDDNTPIRDLVTAARKVLQRDGVDSCLVRIVDDDTWTVAADLVVRLTKAGFHPAVDARWVLMFGPQHAPPETPDGVFLLCRPETGNRWRQRAPWQLVAQTSDVMLYWRRAAVVPDGEYAADDLEWVATRLDGFSKPERDGSLVFRWSNGPQSRLDVQLEPGRAYRVVVAVRPLEVPSLQQSVTVLLNGREVAEISLPHAAFEAHAFTLPAGLVARHNTLTFRYRYAQSPQTCEDTGDERELAVCFAKIAFRKAGD